MLGYSSMQSHSWLPFDWLKTRIYWWSTVRFPLLLSEAFGFSVRIECSDVGVISFWSLVFRFINSRGQFCFIDQHISALVLRVIWRDCLGTVRMNQSCDWCPFRTFGLWRFTVIWFGASCCRCRFIFVEVVGWVCQALGWLWGSCFRFSWLFFVKVTAIWLSSVILSSISLRSGWMTRRFGLFSELSITTGSLWTGLISVVFVTLKVTRFCVWGYLPVSEARFGALRLYFKTHFLGSCWWPIFYVRTLAWFGRSWFSIPELWFEFF